MKQGQVSLLQLDWGALKCCKHYSHLDLVALHISYEV
eukprot:gene9062-4580_t